MAKMFYSYNRFRDDTANALVESLHDLSADVVAKKNDTQEYSEKNAQFNLAFAKYCVEMKISSRSVASRFLAMGEERIKIRFSSIDILLKHSVTLF